MKRVFCLFLAFIFGLATFATPVFAGKNSSGNLSTHAVEINTDVTEDMILNKQDIISVDYNNLPSNLKSMAKQGETPFDYATQKCLDGVSISPSADEYGQTNVTAFLVSSVFSITEAESLYLWVYIPDTIALVLTIEVKSADGETLSWTLTPNDFGDILSTSVVGWKLLELPASAATKTLNDKVLSSINFTTFSLRYYKDETIEITSFLEPLISEKEQDYAHRAFNKLFLEYEIIEDTILIRRKSRDKSKSDMFLAVNLYAENEIIGETEFEVDKEKFYGREAIGLPKTVESSIPLGRNIGLTTEPIVAIKNTAKIKANEKVAFNLIMCVSESKEKVIELINKFTN